MATPDASHSAAVHAVVRFARDVARLPAFPIEPWLKQLEDRDAESIETRPSVLKPVETDRIPGDVLPRGDDTWLALLPFQDLTKHVTADVKLGLLQKRRALVSLIVTLATSPPPSAFRWEPVMMNCGESAGPGIATNSFWLELLRALGPEYARDPTQELTRRLVTMARHRSPRFLLCIPQDVTSGDIPELLAQFLEGDTVTTESVFAELAKSGVLPKPSGQPSVTVEVGLSFAKGKISHTFLTKLFDALNRAPASNSDGAVQLRITALRFGPECSFQAKAIELLGERKTPSSLQHISLCDLTAIKPASLRIGLNGLLSSQRGLRHMGTSTFDGFKAVASAVRNGDTCATQMDLALELTTENATWLAFGFFHADSRSCVSSLRLRLPRIRQHAKAVDMVTSEWLDTFKRVLKSATADRDLADMEGDDSESQEDVASSRKFVRIRAGTAVKSALFGGAKLLCKVLDEKEEFELIADADNSNAIVVSGLGVGWVPAASVLGTRCAPTRISGECITNGMVKMLVVDSTTRPCENRTEQFDKIAYKVHVDTLVDLLSVIGEPLESLHLPMLKLKTIHLTQILMHCPNLTELNIGGHQMLSIGALYDAYASGSCKIDSLSIVHGNSLHLQGPLTLEMREILRGPGRRVLRRFAVQTLPSGWDTNVELADGQGYALSFKELVSTTDTLEFVQLPSSSLREIEQSVEATADESDRSIGISAHPFCFAKMPLRCKLAFLSCLDHTRTDSARNRLDASLLAQILRFSAETIPRRVLMHAPLALERCECCSWIPHRAMADELARRAW